MLFPCILVRKQLGSKHAYVMFGYGQLRKSAFFFVVVVVYQLFHFLCLHFAVQNVQGLSCAAS